MFPKAQVVGIDENHISIKPTGAVVGTPSVRTKVIWSRVQFDTHPAKTDASAGLVVLRQGTNLPSGNFICRESGYYRFAGQAYILPPAQTLSLYLGLYSLGADGKDETLIAVGNATCLPGAHPSVTVDRIVPVTLPNSYYDFKVHTYVGNEIGRFAAGEHYCWASIEYLGEI